MEEGDSSFLSVCERGDFNLAVRILSSEDFDPQSLSLNDGEGLTPLHYACRSGNVQLVRILIEKYHCDPESKGGWRRTTPLHEACRYEFPLVFNM